MELTPERDRRVDELRDRVFKTIRAAVPEAANDEAVMDSTLAIVGACSMWLSAVAGLNISPEEIGERWGEVITDFVHQVREHVPFAPYPKDMRSGGDA